MKLQYKKAVQALNFFARCNSSRKISKLKVLKLIFLADRYHLRKYGRMITNDRYLAMKLGPVASSVKDLAEHSSFLPREEREYTCAYLHEVDADHNLRSQAEVDWAIFSETDKEALNFVMKKFQHGRCNLVDLTHQFPEWQKHEQALSSGRIRSIDMNPVDFFETGDQQYEYCPLTDEEIMTRKELFQESLFLESSWR